MPVASSIVTLAKNLIGDDFTTDITNAVPEILEVAIRDVIDIVPENLLLKYTTLSYSVDNTNGKKSGITSNSSTQSTKNIKILRVKRDVFDCKEIPYSYKQQAEDDSSMFLATMFRYFQNLVILKLLELILLNTLMDGILLIIMTHMILY